jgi:hypothetical protein
MWQWLRDLLDRRLYVIRYDFTRFDVHMVGTSRLLPMRKARAKRIAKWMCDLYGAGTHWPEAA